MTSEDTNLDTILDVSFILFWNTPFFTINQTLIRPNSEVRIHTTHCLEFLNLASACLQAGTGVRACGPCVDDKRLFDVKVWTCSRVLSERHGCLGFDGMFRIPALIAV